VTVSGVDGKPARLADLDNDGPIVLTFYCGVWHRTQRHPHARAR